MNKAFVKEDTEALNDFNLDLDMEDDFLMEGEADLDGAPKNYITRSGYERLKKELDHLLHEERPQSENAKDPEGKMRLREIDHRIRFLQRRIDRAEVVDPEQQVGDRVLFGATVTVLDEDEKERHYQIVGNDEVDTKIGKISWSSPVGRALLQSKVGDVVAVMTPHGEEDFEILKIEYQPIQ